MIKLNGLQTSMVSGGELVAGDNRSYQDQFWSASVQAAGTACGVIASPAILVGMLVSGVAYYAVYTPVYYTVSGVYHVVTYPFRK